MTEHHLYGKIYTECSILYYFICWKPTLYCTYIDFRDDTIHILRLKEGWQKLPTSIALVKETLAGNYFIIIVIKRRYKNQEISSTWWDSEKFIFKAQKKYHVYMYFRENSLWDFFPLVKWISPVVPFNAKSCKID